MSQSAGAPGDLRLRRNRVVGLVAATCFLGLGAAIAIVAWGPPLRPVGLVLAAVLLIPGVWVIPLMLRPWRLDSAGIILGRRRVLTWEQIEVLEVRAIRPVGAGRGPAHVTVVLRGDDRRVTLVLYSRRDAEDVTALLESHLPNGVAGRDLLARIPAAWTGIR